MAAIQSLTIFEGSPVNNANIPLPSPRVPLRELLVVAQGDRPSVNTLHDFYFFLHESFSSSAVGIFLSSFTTSAPRHFSIS
jgi:hypothetical protein